MPEVSIVRPSGCGEAARGRFGMLLGAKVPIGTFWCILMRFHFDTDSA